MATESWLETERNGQRRRYTVWYTDPSPEREEAVRFFAEQPYGLHPAMDLPPRVHKVPLAEANEYLRAHPIPELYSLLMVTTPIDDDDLARLRFLPELKVLKLHCDVTDSAVRHILSLDALESLLIYSSRVTDECLPTIAELSELRSLDMQASRNVSPASFDALVKRMPKLRESWPPWSPHNPPMQRTGAAGIFSGVRKWLGRGPGR